MRTRFAWLGLSLLLGCNDTPTSPSAHFELALSPSAVVAGAASVGTVTLRGRAVQAIRINLSSSDAVASVPPSVLVPAATGTVEFTVKTRLVAADTVARISAQADGTTQEVALQVVAPIARPATLDRLALDAVVVRGGQDLQGTVWLTAAAPAGGLAVKLRSSNAVATVAATLLIPAGATSEAFTLGTRRVTLETQLEITATYSDQIKTVPLRVIPIEGS